MLAMMATPRAAQIDAARTADEGAVRQAIVDAVRMRMGSQAQVTFGAFRMRGVEAIAGSVLAVPDAGARTGGFARFMLHAGSATARRIGSVDAEVFVALPHLRARRDLAPRAIVAREDVEDATEDVGRQPFDPMPSASAIVGARVVRPIAAGRTIAMSMVTAPPLVRSGDEVRTIVRVGGLEARGTAIAAQTGTLGDEIRVVNADSRRTLKVRVVGEGQVEVIHER
jgi:flagella basal body P-ring formation protein FlgA